MCADRIAPTAIRVLVVEDNPDDAFLLERHLRRNHFVPVLERVETAQEMLEALEQTAPRPDIILADYHLPNFSGPHALQILRSTGLDIPFIMLSGAVSEETAVEAMRSGAQDYVSKQNLLRLIPAIQRELKDAAIRRNRLDAERALVASEARFSSLVELLPLGMIITDGEGRILYTNKAIEGLLGYAVSNMVHGALSLESVSPALSELQHKLVAATENLLQTELDLRRRDGTSLHILAGLSLLNPDAEPEERQVVISLTDLTLQKKSEEVIRRTEKLAVAGRLAASISHEINNPLEAITNCLYLLGKTDLSSEARDYLELAQKELDRVSQITVQTLRFYRSSTRISQTDIHELIQNVLLLLEGRLRQAEITIYRDLRADPSTISAHDGEIRQVVVNLISNAIDAVPPGGSIRVRTRLLHHPVTGEQALSITIADNGVGIARETQKKIFEPFYSTKGITGTGLGLWISSEIVTNHHGLLRIHSRTSSPGRRSGSIFTLILPRGRRTEVEWQRPRGTIAGMPKLEGSRIV